MHSTMAVDNIAVVGCGLMGQGIAQTLARAGYAVIMHDVTQARVDKALAGIEASVKEFVERKLMPAREAKPLQKRIRVTTSLPEATAEADLLIEAAFEDLELKQDLFGQFERLCPKRTVLVSSTSALSATAIAQGTSCPQRVLVAHYWNPPALIPLVEVVPGEKTSQRSVRTLCAVLEKSGMRPVVLKKDVPGFIGNRLQFALLREAVHLVETGVASAEDVDMVAEMTFGRRLSITGPLKSADLAGLDAFKDICQYLFKDLCNATEPQALLTECVTRGRFGAKTGKGFYDWTPESEQKACDRRKEELIRWL